MLNRISVVGKFSRASDELIALEDRRQVREFRKSEVAAVYSLTQKPWTDAQEYASHEVLDWLFVPTLWPYIFGYSPTIPVRLYDSSVDEDNTPVVCRNRLQ